ncbi:MAG: DUF3313 family protein [Anaerolineales bacterium]|nr:DUF3313 family protein [Anaerolineales bacterium]
MKKMMTAILAMTIVFCFVTGAGWAADKTKPRSGFLHDYSKLTANDPMKIVEWIYIKEDTDWKSYNKVMLDDVVFFIAQDAEYKGFEAKELASLGEAFCKAFIMNLAGATEFTDEPGPGVLRIRLAVTNLKPTKSLASTVTTVVPVGLALSTVAKGVTGSHIGMGSVAVEAELLDSQSGEVLAAMIDEKMGKKYKVLKSTSKWGHVIDIFNKWGQTFRARWDKRMGE